MTEKYYIDTAIWRDLHENRSDRFRPLGDWAFELFKKIRKDKGKILYSNLIIDELSIAYNKEIIKKLFEDISELLEKVEIKKEQIKEAKKLNKELKIPFGDVLHGILARDNNAIMITRDHHFEELQGMVDVKKPEELI